MSFSSLSNLVEYFDRFYEGQEFNLLPVNLMCIKENSFADRHKLHSDISTATAAQSSYANVSERIKENAKNDSHSRLCFNTCSNTTIQSNSADVFKCINSKALDKRNSNS